MWNPFAKQKPTPPPTVPTDRIIPLYCFDDHAINRAVLVRFMLRFDDVLSPEKLKTSLEKLLSRDDWRKLGARLRLNDKGKLEYHVPTSYSESRPAVQFSHVKHDMGIAEHDVTSKLPKATLKPAVVVDSDMLMPLFDTSGFPSKLDEYLYADVPQLGLYVISFNDATLVTLSWPHTLLDAMAQHALLAAWTLVMAGREDEVAPLHGFDNDLLNDLGKNVSADTWKLNDRVLPGWKTMIFAARYVFDLVWHKQEEARIICMPAATLKALREKAMQELATEKAEYTFVTEGDVLCAWWSRYAISHLNHDSDQTVAIMNIFDIRKVLTKDLLPPPGVYVANAVLSVAAFFTTRQIFHAPLSQIAMGVRRSVAELGTREQIEAQLAMLRPARDATGYPPIVGDPTMHMLTVTNWTRGKFFDVDFSAAVVQEGPNITARPNRIGQPSFLLPYGIVNGFSNRNAMAVLGKDAAGTYWLSAVLRKGLWADIERELAAAED